MDGAGAVSASTRISAGAWRRSPHRKIVSVAVRQSVRTTLASVASTPTRCARNSSKRKKCSGDSPFPFYKLSSESEAKKGARAFVASGLAVGDAEGVRAFGHTVSFNTPPLRESQMHVVLTGMDSNRSPNRPASSLSRPRLLLLRSPHRSSRWSIAAELYR